MDNYIISSSFMVMLQSYLEQQPAKDTYRLLQVLYSTPTLAKYNENIKKNEMGGMKNDGSS